MLTRLRSLLFLSAVAFMLIAAGPARADEGYGGCGVPRPIVAALISDFTNATQNVSDISLFTPKLMWLAVVDRQSRVCTVYKVGDAWPGSRQIAIAKASTANDFSNDKLALSTAMLYGATIPQGSLFGLNESNTYNGFFNDPAIAANGHVPGGIITFGGGLALYSGGNVIGGLGVSGDTACADHDVAWYTRNLAISQNVVAAPVTNDNIAYESPVVPGHFTHPYCLGGEVPPARVSGLAKLHHH